MALPSTLTIPNSTAVNGEISVPGSKSLTNRALLVAALAEGTSLLKGVLHSDDTKYMTEALQNLGVRFEVKPEGILVEGKAGRLGPTDQLLYVQNAGTAARFLTAALGLGEGEYRLDGNQRMRQRPIGDLIDALGSLGVKVVDEFGNRCPPLLVQGGGYRGGQVSIRGDQSSQYLSALMLTAVNAQADTEVTIMGPLVSRTYVEMTRKLIADFGGTTSWVADDKLLIPGGQQYQACEYSVEGDASSASYFFALAAITGGKITVKGIRKDSTQGDLGLVYILESMGCKLHFGDNEVTLEGGPLKAVEVDMNSMSDVAQTLAVVALFAEGTTVIRNVANMRIKECDRITAMTTELNKLGAQVTEFPDGLSVVGGKPLHGASLATYDDHRMAMALSLAGLRVPGVQIEDPACVSKTFPDFFGQLFPLIEAATPADQKLLSQL